MQTFNNDRTSMRLACKAISCTILISDDDLVRQTCFSLQTMLKKCYHIKI